MANHWWKDAVIYAVDVERFFDSDGDGIGDFKGLTSQLGYISELGVTCIWLLPFYPSSGKDNGYAIIPTDQEKHWRPPWQRKGPKPR